MDSVRCLCCNAEAYRVGDEYVCEGCGWSRPAPQGDPLREAMQDLVNRHGTRAVLKAILRIVEEGAE